MSVDKKKDILGVAGVIALSVALFALLRLPCTVVFITGCPCPGCGMTRAYKELLSLNFSKAFYYHPLWPLMPALALLFAWAYIKEKEMLKKIISIAFVVSMVVTYVIRLFIGPDEVMACNFEESVIYRAYIFFKGVINS